MKTFVVSTHGHQIVIKLSIWTGKETILCDEQVVSEKRSYLQLTAHFFEVQEQGAAVVYEVNVLGGYQYGYIVRRNGIIVACAP